MTATATTTTQSKSSQKLLPADVRWCIDNKDDLSLVTYVDHFTLASRGYAVRRYKHIIKKYIPRDERGRLLSELKFFKNTVRYYQYWYDIMQRKLVIKAKYRSSILLDAAMKNQAKEVLISFRGESSSNNSHNTTTEEDDSDAADVNLTTEDSLPDTSSVDDNHGASSTSSSPRALSHNSSDHSEDYEFDSDSCCLKHTKPSDGSSRGGHSEEGDRTILINRVVRTSAGFFI